MVDPHHSQAEMILALVAAAGDGLIAIDGEGTIVVFNPAAGRIFGHDPQEILGKDLSTLFVPEMFVEHQRYVEDYFNGKGRGVVGSTIETVGRRSDGTTVPIEISLSSTMAGQERLVLASIRDITARRETDRQNRELMAQLTQAQKMEALGTLAAGIAHDFNNMLGAIMGYASAMTRELDGSHPHTSDAQQILTIARRAKRLTDKLLAFARKSEAGSEVFSVNRVVRDAVGLLSRTIPKNIVLKTKLARDVNTEGDRTQLEQVLVNLCLNSRDAMPDGGEILIATRRAELDEAEARRLGLGPGSYGCITVKDNGMGMSGGTLERAFDPFFSTKPPGEGSGLGLSLVYAAVTGHGGQVKVESEPGSGTAVSVYLPAANGEPRRESGSVPMLVRQAAGNGERILLVDDERHLRDMAKRLLEGLGYCVVLAGSGEEAEAYYRDNHAQVDLVILDVVMAGLSGAETLERLKEINRGVRVLVSSGHSRDGEPRDLLHRGVCGFIQKPYGIDEVSVAIQKALAQNPS